MDIKSKNYNQLEYIRIPLKISPMLTIGEIIFRVLIGLLPVVEIITTAYFIDIIIDILKNGNMVRIYKPIISILLVLIFSFLAQSILSFFKLEINLCLSKEFLPKVIKKQGMLKYKYIEDDESWNLISRVRDKLVQNIQNGFENLLDISEVIIKIVSIFILIASDDLRSAIVFFILSLTVVFLCFINEKVNYDDYVKGQLYMQKADYLKNILCSKDTYLERFLFGYTKEINKLWELSYEKACDVKNNTGKQKFIKTKLVISIVNKILSIVNFCILLLPLLDGKITVGMYIGLVISSLSLVEGTPWQLRNIIKEYPKYKLYIKDFSIFSKMEEVKGADKPKDLSIRSMPFESIEFKNVSFAYPGTSHKVLNNFSMYVEKNKHYAIVGKNGAGKSTFIKLLIGLYDNYEGEILINGKNIRSFTYEQLKAYFSIVYQDFAKYFINIKDNVLLGNNKEKFYTIIQDQIVHNALIDMDMEYYVSSLENGIYTKLGNLDENGLELSGGQWQKLALMRTLISNAPFYILDEPTAALDPISENILYKLFSKASMGKSIFLITHRLSAARICDEIFVIDKGTVIEHGTHKELINKNGVYAEMFKTQGSWYHA